MRAAVPEKSPAPEKTTANGGAARLLRLVLGFAGVATLGYGAWGLLRETHAGALASLGRWLLGGLILHDAVLAPAVFVACAIAYRITGPRLRRAMAAILLIGGSAVLVALPEFLLPPGNPNPTVHPLNYARDLAIIVGSVVAVALLHVLLASRRDRRHARAKALRESLQTEEASPPPPAQGPIPGPDA